MCRNMKQSAVTRKECVSESVNFYMIAQQGKEKTQMFKEKSFNFSVKHQFLGRKKKKKGKRMKKEPLVPQVKHQVIV